MSKPQRRPPGNGEKPSYSSDEPEKIKWVLVCSDPVQGDTWKSFVGDPEIPDSMSREWSKKFYKAMDTNSSAPRSDAEMTQTSPENSEQPSYSSDEPEKVKWVLVSSDPVQGDTWNPFVGDREVPDSVSRIWSKKIYKAMHTNSSAPWSDAEMSKTLPENDEQPSYSSDEQEKVKWVLVSSDPVQGDTWKLFMGDREIPDCVSRKLSEKFSKAKHTNSFAPRSDAEMS